MTKKVFLIDLSHKSKLGLGSDMMPLQIGLIGAWLLERLGDRIDLQLFRDVDEFAKAVEAEPPFIIGASNYMWNLDLTSQFLTRIKARHPQVITVMGGPNYPDNEEERVEWLAQRPEVDIYVYRDGELPFANLVEAALADPDITRLKTRRLPSCHAIHQGQAFFGEVAERPRNLTAMPSPYLVGLMDKFFEERLLPPMQTNRGCPFSCSFCTEGSRYYNKVATNSLEKKIKEVEYIAARVKHTRTLRLTDSNFGMYPEDVEFARFLGDMRARTGFPEYLLCTTGKNNKERVMECNDLLGGILRLTASVQALDKQVLANVKRSNISIEEMTYMSDRTSDTDAATYSELILGLPGDSLAAQMEAFRTLVNSGIGLITQHQLGLIHGAEISIRSKRAEYAMVTKFRPIMRSVGRYTLFGEEFVSVETEEICVGNNTLSDKDYLAARILFLIVGVFYNDRVFGEIHALLRLLGIPTFEWVQHIIDRRDRLTPELAQLFRDFEAETMGELWSDAARMKADVAASIDRYLNGEIGGNIIYKYRSMATVRHFDALAENAYAMLRSFAESRNLGLGAVIDDLERFARYQKSRVADLDMVAEDDFAYDIPRLIGDVGYARSGGTLDGLKRPLRLRFGHSPEKRDMISRQFQMYGSDVNGLTMIYARFAVKQLYRSVEEITPPARSVA